MREMKITTFEGHDLVIKFDRHANVCYSMKLPNNADVTTHLKYTDYVDADDPVESGATWYSGSLTRMLNWVGEYVGQTEL